MIAVTLDYRVGPDEIARHRAAHLDWLREGRDAGVLLMSARRVPVTGGMLLLHGSMAAARAWTATDPFATRGLANYTFVQLESSMAAPGLEGLIDSRKADTIVGTEGTI